MAAGGRGPADLTAKLDEAGHLVSLPKESAALANVIEVALVDFLLDRLDRTSGAAGRRGEERSYPDLEISGEAFGGEFHAVDVKMARLNKNGKQTQSRCTLYTGNTYFKWRSIRWPGMFRPFDDYTTHLDIIGVYRLDIGFRGRVRDLELSSTNLGGSPPKSARVPLASTSVPSSTSPGSGRVEASSRPKRRSTSTGRRSRSGCPKRWSSSSGRRSENRGRHNRHRALIDSHVCSIFGPPFHSLNMARSIR